MTACVSYPLTFLLRPCDDALCHDLSVAGIPEEKCRLMCFLAWRHFAMGGSGRIQLRSGGGWEGDPRVASIERACGWDGVPGGFISTALACGFFSIDTAGGVSYLCCVGFQEHNRGKAQSIQRHGGLVKALKAHLREAERGVEEKEELWRRTGGGSFEGLNPERRRMAMVLIMRICRALSRPIPSDAVLSNGAIHLAAKCVEDHADSIDATLLWVFDRRSELTLPERLDDIFREWPEYTRRAAEERGAGG